MITLNLHVHLYLGMHAARVLYVQGYFKEMF